ncbi:MAG: cobyric acid synthase [Nitrospirae bacterium]|nr:cobyric acid synthase [Nitrospirota bacterium]
MTKALMIQGTGSGAGKSLIAAALCRIFADEGVRVAPFKAQNMALNSFITQEGSEIGRAQALQAEAARVVPTVDMNPILLKASGEMGSQVIIHGRAFRYMKAQEYYTFKKEAWKAVTASYEKLAKAFDLIIMEGAGSPAEINLMDVDIVNMSAAKMARAPVLLVGDIDKGGVFASLYGTVKLLGRDSRHIKGFIINKFRGDMEILRPGLQMIQDRTGKPVIGVLPYVHDLGLPEEDGMALSQGSRSRDHGSKEIRIVIVRLKYISNFTDFDPLAQEPDVELVYSTNPAEIENADMVIVPGSKNTVKDLLLLRKQGLDKSISRAFAKGIEIMGMCGGYQMLGSRILDPHHAESSHPEVEGLGLLNIETIFENEKITCQVEAEEAGIRDCGSGIGNSANPQNQIPNPRLSGYEIHMGRSTGDIGLFRIRRLSSDLSPITHHSSRILDGSVNKNCWGTYLHGIFDNNTFRRDLLNRIREKKGLPVLPVTVDYTGMKEKALDNLAAMVKKNIDMEFLRRILTL